MAKGTPRSIRRDVATEFNRLTSWYTMRTRDSFSRRRTLASTAACTRKQAPRHRSTTATGPSRARCFSTTPPLSYKRNICRCVSGRFASALFLCSGEFARTKRLHRPVPFVVLGGCRWDTRGGSIRGLAFKHLSDLSCCRWPSTGSLHLGGPRTARGTL